jgi:hypothetical protein
MTPEQEATVNAFLDADRAATAAEDEYEAADAARKTALQRRSEAYDYLAEKRNAMAEALGIQGVCFAGPHGE